MKGNLLIVGDGQYGQVAKETAIAMGVFSKIAFLDDYSSVAIGKIAEYEKFLQEYPYAFVAIGNAEFRLEMLEKLKMSGFHIPILINPMSYVSPSAVLGEGTIVEAKAVVNANAMLGRGVFVCAGSIINHNARIEECSQIDCGAVVGANAVVSDRKKVRYNEVIQKSV